MSTTLQGKDIHSEIFEYHKVALMGVKRQRGWIWKDLGEKLNKIKTQNTLNKNSLRISKTNNNNNKTISMGLQEAYLPGNSRFCKINI